jgi:biotin synthase
MIETFKRRAIQQNDICLSDALKLSRLGEEHLFHVLAAATEIREHFKGKQITLCGIVNAKSGKCSEDCKFCAQSSHYKTASPAYPLLSAEKIIEQALDAQSQGAHMFGVVTSGKRISKGKDWEEICKAIRGIHGLGIKPCASLGLIDKEKAVELKQAGLFRYHHNLETSRSFFKNICTTHLYEEDIQTIMAAKDAMLSICCGGLLGLGESMAHRIELAMTLKGLDVDSVPINILNPIPGTPLAQMHPLPPLEILLTIAVFRFILPAKDIKLCGGKEKNLRQLLPLAIVAGCNSLMTGNYLTTSGRNTKLDLEMITDLGLTSK